MKKDFKIARKPGQGSVAAPAVIDSEPVLPLAVEAEPAPKKPRTIKEKPVARGLGFELGATTRKTIEVPEGYFYQVKLQALHRRMKEKELWAEILHEYFINHSTL